MKWTVIVGGVPYHVEADTMLTEDGLLVFEKQIDKMMWVKVARFNPKKVDGVIEEKSDDAGV